MLTTPSPPRPPGLKFRLPWQAHPWAPSGRNLGPEPPPEYNYPPSKCSAVAPRSQVLPRFQRATPLSLHGPPAGPGRRSGFGLDRNPRTNHRLKLLGCYRDELRVGLELPRSGKATRVGFSEGWVWVRVCHQQYGSIICQQAQFI